MTSILSDPCAAQCLIFEHILVENHQVAVDTVVDFEITQRLDTDVVKELVVESVDWEGFFHDSCCVFYFLIVNVLQVVIDKSVAVDPHAFVGDEYKTMCKLLLLARRWDNL